MWEKHKYYLIGKNICNLIFIIGRRRRVIVQVFIFWPTLLYSGASGLRVCSIIHAQLSELWTMDRYRAFVRFFRRCARGHCPVHDPVWAELWPWVHGDSVTARGWNPHCSITMPTGDTTCLSWHDVFDFTHTCCTWWTNISHLFQRLCKPDPCCRVPFGEMFSLPNKPHLFSRLLIVLSWTLTFNRWPEAREVWALHCANTPESFRTAKCPNVYTYTGAHSCWGAVSLIPLEFPHDSKNQPITDVTRQELHVFTITSYYVLVQRARSLCEYDVALTRYSFRTRWTHVFEVAEGDELNDVPEDGLSFGWAQDPVVAVQHLHVAEVGVPDPNDDDGHGEVGSLNDGLPRVGHVGDDAVCQDQQDEVLLEDWTWRDPVRPAPVARTISLNPAGFKRSSGSISNYIHIYVCVCVVRLRFCAVWLKVDEEKPVKKSQRSHYSSLVSDRAGVSKPFLPVSNCTIFKLYSVRSICHKSLVHFIIIRFLFEDQTITESVELPASLLKSALLAGSLSLSSVFWCG